VTQTDFDRMIMALGSAAKAIEEGDGSAPGSDKARDRNAAAASVSRLSSLLEQAVDENDVELLLNLSLVAEGFSRNRKRAVDTPELDAHSPLGAVPVEYEAYVWHDVADDWCYSIPELGIEERNHLQPDNIAWFASAAASMTTGAPSTIRLTIGPSTDGAGNPVKEPQVPTPAA
jgi:hypothetical protein